MFKKLLQDESGQAHTGTVILTGIFIGTAVVLIALTYGMKITTLLNSLGDKF